MRFLLLLLMTLLAPTVAEAQIFKRWRSRAVSRTVFRPAVQSSCPGGQCPVDAVEAPPVQGDVKFYWQVPGAAWTHPDTIQSHMSGTHGIDITGKSGEELVRMHDAIHAGSGVGMVLPRSRTVTRSRAVVRQRASVKACPSGGCPVPMLIYP